MKKSKIMVVDDEQRMRKIINDFLTKDGYTVVEACDGEDALDKFYADSDIDLILLVFLQHLHDLKVVLEKNF